MQALVYGTVVKQNSKFPYRTVVRGDVEGAGVYVVWDVTGTALGELF